MRSFAATKNGFLQVISITCICFLFLIANYGPDRILVSENNNFDQLLFPIANTIANITPQKYIDFLPLTNMANYNTTPPDYHSIYDPQELYTSTVSDATYLRQNSPQSANTTHDNNTSNSKHMNTTLYNHLYTNTTPNYKHQQHNPYYTYHTPTHELRPIPHTNLSTPLSPLRPKNTKLLPINAPKILIGLPRSCR